MNAFFDLIFYLAILSLFFGASGIIVTLIMKIPVIDRKLNKFYDTLPMSDDDWE